MPKFPEREKFRLNRFLVGCILFFFLATQVFFGVFLYAKPAQALMPIEWLPGEAQISLMKLEAAAKKAYDEARSEWWVALSLAVMNAATQFVNKIAYDFAVALATMSPGQKPAFFTQDWETYLRDTALGAAGEFLGSLSESLAYDKEAEEGVCAGVSGKKCKSDTDCPVAPVGGPPKCVKETVSIKFNLCKPPDPRITLGIMFGLAGVKPPTPKCQWADIQKQWGAFIAEAQTGEVLSRMGLQFKPGGGSDLQNALEYNAKLTEQISAKSDAATKQRQEGQGFKPLTEKLWPGFTKTPSVVIKEEAAEMLSPENASDEDIKKATELASSSGTVLEKNALFMLNSLVSTFVDTLSSKLLERLVKKGLISAKDIYDYIMPEDILGSPEFASIGGQPVAEAVYADFITPRVQEISGFSPLVNLSACPQGVSKSPENCTLDDQFVHAVNQATMGDPLTVRQALQKGFLHGDWPLIPPSDGRNANPFCFQKGYCYSNLMKLRKYRIIPVGWEMAASLSNGTVKFKEVVDKFDDCGDEGVADEGHRWCHLIDPDWLLKSPVFQCRAQVYSEVSTEGGRQELCVDAPSCIEEDEQGNCEVGWGYCVREKNIWRLPGDKCDEQFDSCRALRSRTGENKSLLVNTVDYGPPCTPDDAGCRWYSTRQEKVGDEWRWQDEPSAGSGTKTDRIYFNKNVAQCTAPGCSEFFKTVVRETSLNWIQNSSFEIFTGTADDNILDTYDNWKQVSDARSNGYAVLDVYSGTNAIKLSEGLYQKINTGQSLAGRTFTLSLYAKNCGEATAILNTSFVSLAEIENNQWERKLKTVGFPAGTAETVLTVRLAKGADTDCLLDAVQLEEMSEPTPYHEGWAGKGDALYMKKAPDYYNCYNYNSNGTVKTSDDADECQNYIGACQESEVGCEQYTPVAGGPSIPGIATYPDDYCPEVCVGYQTFKQLNTNFEQDEFPVFFIPRTGGVCPAAEEGCDEFTSLETEAKENYSYLRQCQKPTTDSATYYTWEGSDTAGYQLKTWSLKASNLADTIIADKSPEGGTGPCTKLAVGGVTCNDDQTTGTCAKADMATDPDCREFYDQAGKRHYRLYSKTIVSTDDCHPYRKTTSNQSDCQASGGKWDATKSDCNYMMYPAESRRCSAVGCRAYRGNTGANVMDVFQSDFENWPDNWSGTNISQNTEALVSGGHSVKIQTDATASKPVGDLIRKDGIYLISFWAKAGAANGKAEVQFNDGTATADRLATPLSVNLSLTWQPYTLGPIQVTWDPTRDNPGTTPVTESELLRITAKDAFAYFDNIVFQEVTDRIYLVKDSWTTPASCDMTAFGGYLPQAMLGCAEYRDRDNRQHFLKSFTNLCREEAIGCQKLIDAKNTDSPYDQTFNAICYYSTGVLPGADCSPASGQSTCDCLVNTEKVCSVSAGEKNCRYSAGSVFGANKTDDTVVLPADSYAFLIVDQAKSCNGAEVGCQSFGAPKLDSSDKVVCELASACPSTLTPPATTAMPCDCERDGEVMCKVQPGVNFCVGEFETVNFLNDETKYSGQGRILCQKEYQSCEEYVGTDSAKFYFKDPGKRTCEWKENITYNSEQRTGWFRKDDSGALEPCYLAYTRDGIFSIWKNADTGYGKYGKWVGLCPAQQNLCTKFIDPAATSAENPKGEPYYYIKNDKIGPGDCNGQVSLKQGCVLFDDTSDLSKTYSATATYDASESGADGAPKGGKVNPVDCSQDPASEFCKRCYKLVEVNTPSGTIEVPRWSSYSCKDTNECNTKDSFEGWTSCMKWGAPNNSNLILKVRRDRVCGQWMSCKTHISTWDRFANQKRQICEGLGLCDKYSRVGQSVECAEFIDKGEPPKILDLNAYTSRDVTWKGYDYSGYSIPNQFQAYKLSQINVADKSDPSAPDQWRLAMAAPPGETCGGQNLECTISNISGPSGPKGKCYNHICAYDPAGQSDDSGLATPKALESSTPFAQSCRAYPEADSPFPASVEEKYGFQNVRVCDDPTGCECNYKKVSYGGEIKYFNKDKTDEPSAICVGGSEAVAGTPCTPDSCPGDSCECNYPPGADGVGKSSTGSCSPKQRDDRVFGLPGYCLEKERSTNINGDQNQFACLSWLPVDRLAGAVDMYNLYPDAGFVTTQNIYYCLEPEVYKQIKARTEAVGVEDEIGCGGHEEIVDDLFDDSALEHMRCKGEEYDLIVSACGGAGDGNVRYICLPRTSYGFDGNLNQACDPASDSRLVQVSVSGSAGNYTINIPDPLGYSGLYADGVNPNTDWGEYLLDKAVGGTMRIYYIKSGAGGSPDYETVLVENVKNSYVASDGKECKATGNDSAQYEPWETANYFLGCKKVAQVATIGDNKAWTDRVWRADRGYEIDKNIPYQAHSKIKYKYTTPVAPFGKAMSPENSKKPLTILSCQHPTKKLSQMLPNPESGSCLGNFTPNGVNEARPYLNISTTQRAVAGGATCSVVSVDGTTSYDDPAKCNRGITCKNMKCWQRCDLDENCGEGETCVNKTRGIITENTEKLCSLPIPDIGQKEKCDPDLGQMWRGECDDGKICSSNPECWKKMCIFGLCEDISREGPSPFIKSLENTKTGDPTYSSPSSSQQLAFDRLNQIFAKIYAVWEWNFSREGNSADFVNTKYNKIDFSSYDTNVTMEPGVAGGGEWGPPKVMPLNSCTDDGRCSPGAEAGAEAGITVNGYNSVDVVSRTGSLEATINFFAWANSNQMPLKGYCIDFGNGVTSPTGCSSYENFYKNSRGWNLESGSTTQCDNTEFGRAPQSCTEDYFSAQTTYTCAKAGDPGWVNPCPSLDVSGGCCVFHPKVQVKDNWGWCNGYCEGRGDPQLGETGCYDNSWYDSNGDGIPDGMNECDINFPSTLEPNKNPWTYFLGSVIVAPE